MAALSLLWRQSMEQKDRTEGLRALIRQGLQALAQQRHTCPFGRPFQLHWYERHRSALGMSTGCTGQKGAANHK